MLKSTHKAIKDYHESLAGIKGIGVSNETGIRAAFQALLDVTSKAYKFRFVPEQRFGDSRIRPDGTVYDDFLPRGWWEAKDSKDDLDKEIEKKIGKGYPTENTIFEDGLRGVLFQNGRETYTADLGKAENVATLLNTFFEFTPPAYKHFDQAKEKFKEHIPELAKNLLLKIEEGHKKNKPFRAAFDEFFELCKNSLNPNIRKEAVEEMLVQHLLTERLIRTVFDNPDFMRRNVIAAAVEHVLDALFAGSESRQAELRKLDRFYVAIEEAARTIPEFEDKQHFLNTLYERFFQGYSVKVADTHGIVYTPQPIVDFMCASVVEVLKTEFGKSLSDPDVFVIDPCTGTGNFIVNLLKRVDPKGIERFYKHQLFANEVMLMPYYIAALNIEHAYFERTDKYEPFEGLCFVDTLDLAEAKQSRLGFEEERNLARVERQRKSPITVVIGNPPYNTNQLDENDNNKNRSYPVIDKRVQETYTRDSQATNRNKLGDAYVRFYRWASDRLEGRPGIVCFVSNNGFLRGIAFDGFRKHLAQDFDKIYHFDFKGNARTSGERRRQEGGNIFADLIRVGVGVTVLVRSAKKSPLQLHYHTVGDYWEYEKKTEYLAGFNSVANVPWQPLTPDKKNNWLVAENADDFETLVPIGSKEAKSGLVHGSIFKIYSLGVSTNRDAWVYSYDETQLKKNVKRLIDTYNADMDKWKRQGKPEDIDSFVTADSDEIKWSSRLKETFRRGLEARIDKQKIRSSLYRPYDKRFLYFDDMLVQRRFVMPEILPVTSEVKNLLICTPNIGSSKEFHVLISDVTPNHDLIFTTQCFPFYIYNEDGTGRRENITDWALEEFRKKYESGKRKAEKKSIDKWSIFYYVYGILHHPGYREKFADNLKRELPRIPFAPDFWAFSEAGKRLSELHLNYEKIPAIWESGEMTVGADCIARAESSKVSDGRRSQPLRFAKDKRIALVTNPKAKPRELYHVEKMKLSKPPLTPPQDVEGKRELLINKHLTVTGIPPEVFEYRLGNRSALEWVVDQYQIKTDKRSGITSDPNREDDPEYIVRLVGQVIRVSLETVKIVKGLPEEFA